MPFEKGSSGNPAGRPSGSTNKKNEEIRNRIISFLDENFDSIQTDLKEIESKDRIKFFIDLLQYGIPKLKTIEINAESDLFSTAIDLSKLSSETLVRIANEMQNIKK